MKIKEGDFVIHNGSLIAKVLTISHYDSQIKVLPLVVKPEYFKSSLIPHWRTIKNIEVYKPTMEELFKIKEVMDQYDEPTF